VKNFLSARGVEFESVNVFDGDDGLADLTRLGARSVPIISRGESYVPGISLHEVAEFVGVEFAAEILSPDQLIEKLDLLLVAAARLIRQLPPDRLQQNISGRDRSMMDLSHHIFKVAEAFLEATAGRGLSQATLDAPPDGFGSAEEIASFGEVIRQRCQNWAKDAKSVDFTQKVDTYYGEQVLHELFERTCWHSAQHVRQLTSMLEDFGVVPDRPLTSSDLKGLPVPDAVWG
jgi:uncharacterized damage-inducible protein DinB